jgi:tetratricopeptide (TPR) repeat protein
MTTPKKSHLSRVQPSRLIARLVLLASLVSLCSSLAISQNNASTFRELSEKARTASEENRLEDAATLYRKALALRPRWAEGWWSLGTLQYDQNHYADAAASFAKLLALQPENGTAHAMLGLCQVELKQDERARQNLSLAQQQGVQNDRQLQHVVLYQLAGAQLRLRRFGDAASNLALLVQDGVRSDEVALGMGMAVLTMPPVSLPVTGTPGRDVVERVGRAETLSTMKEFAAAKQIYTSVASEYPSYPNLHYAFGRFLLEAHEADEAVEEFRKQLQNDPRHVGALLQIAAVLYRTDSANGVKYAQQALKLSPQLPFAHYLVGLLCVDTDRAAEALPHLQIAQRAFPKEAQVYFALGNAYARLGRKADAARMRAEFVRLNTAQKAQKEATDSGIYGDQSSVLSEKLQQQTTRPPPRP